MRSPSNAERHWFDAVWRRNVPCHEEGGRKSEGRTRHRRDRGHHGRRDRTIPSAARQSEPRLHGTQAQDRPVEERYSRGRIRHCRSSTRLARYAARRRPIRVPKSRTTSRSPLPGVPQTRCEGLSRQAFRLPVGPALPRNRHPLDNQPARSHRRAFRSDRGRACFPRRHIIIRIRMGSSGSPV